jgi:hypothetical protein
MISDHTASGTEVGEFASDCTLMFNGGWRLTFGFHREADYVSLRFIQRDIDFIITAPILFRARVCIRSMEEITLRSSSKLILLLQIFFLRVNRQPSTGSREDRGSTSINQLLSTSPQLNATAPHTTMAMYTGNSSIGSETLVVDYFDITTSSLNLAGGGAGLKQTTIIELNGQS